VLAYAQGRNLRSSFATVDSDRTQASRASLQDSVPSAGFGSALEIRPQLGRAELRLGGDLRATSGQSRELFNYVSGQPMRRRVAGGETLNGGVFAEIANQADALMLSGGVRVDYWRIQRGRLLERQMADGAVLRNERYAERSGWLPTARIGLAYDVNALLTLRSAAYLGWRLPTLNELFRPFRAGRDATAANALLDPERLGGIEAGFRVNQRTFSLEATLFANRLRDSIANVTLGSGPGSFPGVGFVAAGGEYRQRINVDALLVRGIEISGEARRGRWTMRLGYSLADAVLRASGPATALDGLRPAQTPRHVGTASVEWADERRSVALALRRVGAQFEDDGNSRKLPPATTVDVFASMPLSRSVSFFARAENLLDAQVVAGVAGDGTAERATPRVLSFGLRLRGSRSEAGS
jgi:outer membrane receptor protein involved in Fe transport